MDKPKGEITTCLTCKKVAPRHKEGRDICKECLLTRNRELYAARRDNGTLAKPKRKRSESKIITCYVCGEDKERYGTRSVCIDCVERQRGESNHLSSDIKNVQKRLRYAKNREKMREVGRLARRKQLAKSPRKVVPHHTRLIDKKTALRKHFYRGFHYRRKYETMLTSEGETVYWQTVPSSINIWQNHFPMENDAKDALVVYLRWLDNSDLGRFTEDHGVLVIDEENMEPVINEIWRRWNKDVKLSA